MLSVDLKSFPELRLDDLVVTPTTTIALLVATAASACCPRCGVPSDRIHSHYRRTVADLPWQDRTVVLRLLVRRFRCPRPECPQEIFCERLPTCLAPSARSTERLARAHRDLGLALGGEAGARLATKLRMPTSGDTLLRRVQRGSDPEFQPPRYIGVDDWAIRKGQRYGTIVVDLERGRVLDLLPGRDGEALKKWLHEHPGVEVITRDRWAPYAEAAKQAAPQTRQIADRWHLLKNLREAVERLLGRMAPAVREAVHPVSSSSEDSAGKGSPPDVARPVPMPACREARAAALSPREQARQTKRHERSERHQQIKLLRAQGQTQAQIAKALGISTKGVRRHLRSAKCPDWNPGRCAPTQLDGRGEQIETWIRGGGRNAAELYRQLKSEGCRASYDAVRRFVRRLLGSTGKPGPRVGSLQPPATPAPPSARRLSFLLLRRRENRTDEEQKVIDRLHIGQAPLREGLDLAASFAALVRREAGPSFVDWLAAVDASACGEMRVFADGLRRDEEAVRRALSEPWSNGPVEGQVNRLKMVKRQMYGRAGMPLLRARVIHAA